MLLESLITLSISVMILLTMSYCVSEQFKLINNWEERVSAHKIILMHLKSPNLNNITEVNGKRYIYNELNNRAIVKVNGKIYYVQKT